MGTPNYSPFPASGASSAAIARLRGRFSPFVLIAAAHALVLYGIYSALLHRVVSNALPAEVFVSFIASPPPPFEPPAPLAAVLILPPPAITPPVTAITIAPLVHAVVAPAPAGQLAETLAPAAAFAAAGPSKAAPAAPAGPRTVSSGVEYLRTPQPDYPALSKRLGEQGKVVLRILVNQAGLPEQVLVQSSSGFARLDEAGRQAALRALFKPYLEDGRPVTVFVIVPLNFQLAG
jgi:protein TonB